MSNTQAILTNSLQVYQQDAYKQGLKTLLNRCQNLIDSYEEELTACLRHMGINMDRAVINRNYIKALEDGLKRVITEQLTNWSKEAISYETRSLPQIAGMASADVTTKKQAYYTLVNGLQRKGIDPKIASITELRQNYQRQMLRIIDRFEDLGVRNISSYANEIQDLITHLFNQATRQYQEIVLNLSKDFAHYYGQAIQTSMNPAEEAPAIKQPEVTKPTSKVLDAEHFPQELMPNFQRLLSLKGYRLAKQNNQFVALNANNQALPISFIGDYNYFTIANRYPEEYFEMDVKITKGKEVIANPSDYYYSKDNHLRYDLSAHFLLIKSNGAYYKLTVNNGQLSIIKSQNNQKESISLKQAQAELTSTFPGVCESYLKSQNLTFAPERQKLAEEIQALEQQAAEIQRQIEEKKAQLNKLDANSPLATFQAALATQKVDDLTYSTSVQKTTNLDVGGLP